MNHKLILAITITLLAAFVIGFGPVAECRYAVGDKVADFTIQDAFGEEVNLYQYEGKVILINFWGSG